jgi:hypothetical protein
MSGHHDALEDCRLAQNMFQGMVSALKQHPNEDILKYQAARIKSLRS